MEIWTRRFVKTSPRGFTTVFSKTFCPVDGHLLPCLLPASPLQVDVNGDGKRPPGSRCVQEHTHSFLRLSPSPDGVWIKLFSLWDSNVLLLTSTADHRVSPMKHGDWGNQIAVHSLGGFLLFTEAQRWVQQHLPTLLCVSIETPTGTVRQVGC